MSGGDHQVDEPTSYTETSAFTRLLAKQSRVKIIDVFLGKHYTELNVKEIAHLAGIDPATVHRNIEDIIEFGLIEEGGTDGRAQRYRLNKDSGIAKILGRARDELMEESDKISRTRRTEFHRKKRGPVNVQESLERFGFVRESHSQDEGPRPSEVVEVQGERASRRLGAES